MNVYEKLNECRLKLQAQNLKKTGKNSYSSYDYFELQDFLPKVNELFKESGLCGIVSFNTETAELMIVNTEKPEEKILITSPMAEANLKGCHAIQNLGAVQTYQRRYLYMAALEIVEHDALDATQGNDKTDGKAHICKDCGKEITATSKSTVEQLLEKSQKYYGVELCGNCSNARYKAKQGAA